MARRQLLISTRRPFSFLAASLFYVLSLNGSHRLNGTLGEGAGRRSGSSPACRRACSAPRPRQDVRVLACDGVDDRAHAKASPVFTTHKLGNWIVHAMAAKCFAREASLREAYLPLKASLVHHGNASGTRGTSKWQSPASCEGMAVTECQPIELRQEAQKEGWLAVAIMCSFGARSSTRRTMGSCVNIGVRP